MGEKAIGALVGIVAGVIGITILAVIVSNQSNTSNVLTAGGNAFSSILKAAVSPISGGGLGSGLLGNTSSGLGAL
jgi:hypothetical protein